MKICFVAPRIHTNQLTLIDSLTKHGHVVHFFCMSNSPEYLKIKPNCTIEVLPVEKLSWLSFIVLKTAIFFRGGTVRQNLLQQTEYSVLHKRLKEIRPDKVIIRDVTLPLALQAFFATRKLSIPTILYNQYPLEGKESILTRAFQFIKLVPRHRITPIRKNLNGICDEKTNAHYVPLTVNSNFDITQKSYRLGNKLNIVFVGKFTLERKNHLLAVKATHEFSKKYSVHLTIVGGYSSDHNDVYREVTDYIKKHKLESIITIRRSIPHTEMPNEYIKADVFLFPSVNEPLSISTLEAMAHATVPIVTKSNGTQYYIRDGVTGFILQKNSIAEINEILEKLQQIEQLQKFSMATYKSFANEYSDTIQYQTFIEAVQ